MQQIGFGATINALASVFLIGLIGYCSVKRRILSHQGVSELARVLVDFILPSLLFYSMFSQFSLERSMYLKWAAITQVTYFTVGVTVALILHRMLRVRSDRGTVAVLSSLQNNAYVPLPIAIALLKPDEAVRAQFYIGCFVLIFNLILWSLGVMLLRGRSAYTGILSVARNVLTPPFLAVVFGAALKVVFLQFHWQMPTLVMDVTRLAGSATVPLAMIVLGGMLAEAQWERDFEPRAVALMTAVKLIVLPAFGLFLVTSLQSRFDPVFAFVMMLQSVSPAATNISLAAKRFGANTSFVAVTLLVTYLLSMITIPLWLLALYR